MGGNVKNPSYKAVSSGNTGHFEVIEIIYNPKITNYNDLLEVFWRIHDPTQVNGQGPDIGLQYQSVIFFILINKSF